MRPVSSPALRRLILLIAAAFFVSTLPASCLTADEVSIDSLGVASFSVDEFEAEIRPLLISHCLKCHGPEKQESDLRIDSRSGLLTGGISGPAIVPKNPSAGTLLAALKHDGDFAMPPNGKLSDSEIARFEAWLAAGAPWTVESQADADASEQNAWGIIQEQSETHWAFQLLTQPTPPAVHDASWPWQDLDRFILAHLEANNLQPVAVADRRTLLRRVTFDLTGLPPTPTEIAEFLADDSPTAFAKVVDRLLDSPHYGERWGRHWLDVARYADTAGDGSDYPVREAYKYRDWVIDAFNNDLPFAEFIRAQVAGDILARERPHDQYANLVIATGFLAVGKRYGYNPGPDFQHLDFADAIDSIGRSLLGLSLGCARCHDHKYEPVSQEDYYALYGILQSTVWAFPGGEEMKRPVQFPPLVPPAEAALLDQQKATTISELDQQISLLKQQLGSLDGSYHAGGVDLAFEKQDLDQPLKTPWLSQGPVVTNSQAQSPFANVHPTGNRGVTLGTGQSGDGIRYVFSEARTAAPGRTLYFSVDLRPQSESAATGSHRLYLGRGVIASLALQCSISKTEFAIVRNGQWETVTELTPGEWVNLTLHIDTESKTYTATISTLDRHQTFEQIPLDPAWDGVIDTFICDGHGHKPGNPAVYDLDNLALQDHPFKSLAHKLAPFVPPSDLAAQQQTLTADLQKLEQQRTMVAASQPYEVAYAVQEGTPTNAAMQLRGEPERPGAIVPRRLLELFGGQQVTAGHGSGRRELADWLADPANPLTARVYVNRIWQWHFGRGLVPTSSDFGLRGDPPSHPQLLDWLTTQFLNSGGSTKALHRIILLSRTYQLASDHNNENFARDPENIYLWRASRRPLDAESVRDSLLVIAGQLDATRPAQHPFPPVDSWGFTIHNPFHAVYESNHRSVYLMQQRNRRHPFLALFDGADPNLSTAQRLPTTTPAQTLYLMNSPFMHAQATALAKRLQSSADNDEQRLQLAFEMTHGRLPTEHEAENAWQFLRTYDSADNRQDIPSQHPRPQAWEALARVLFSSNGFLYVD